MRRNKGQDIAMKFKTKAVHCGQQADPATGSIMTPVYLTSTYIQEEVGKHKGYVYSRIANPTQTALERNVAGLVRLSAGIEDAGDIIGDLERAFKEI